MNCNPDWLGGIAELKTQTIPGRASKSDSFAATLSALRGELRPSAPCRLQQESTSHMPRLIERPTEVEAAGTPPKRIEEFIGRVNSGHAEISVARMTSPSGWREPGQRPEFQEITLVLEGVLHVEHEGGSLDVAAGQAVVTEPGEWIRYSTPDPAGARYVAICLPAFSQATVHRDDG